MLTDPQIVMTVFDVYQQCERKLAWVQMENHATHNALRNTIKPDIDAAVRAYQAEGAGPYTFKHWRVRILTGSEGIGVMLVLDGMTHRADGQPVQDRSLSSLSLDTFAEEVKAFIRAQLPWADACRLKFALDARPVRHDENDDRVMDRHGEYEI